MTSNCSTSLWKEKRQKLQVIQSLSPHLLANRVVFSEALKRNRVATFSWNPQIITGAAKFKLLVYSWWKWANWHKCRQPTFHLVTVTSPRDRVYKDTAILLIELFCLGLGGNMIWFMHSKWPQYKLASYLSVYLHLRGLLKHTKQPLLFSMYRGLLIKYSCRVSNL